MGESRDSEKTVSESGHGHGDDFGSLGGGGQVDFRCTFVLLFTLTKLYK